MTDYILAIDQGTTSTRCMLFDSDARVVAIEGLVLEVEPEVGGARDHRERARSDE